jgi:DNA polymerase-3 subunit delta'
VSIPWLDKEMAALRAAFEADRMPHALLIHEAPGAGGGWLANWIARLLLRTDRDQHPDWISVHPIEESRQIRIEQVRQLAQELSLTSHQGGYKVGVISPADVLNRFAANALLKTLEEPSPRTVLILVVTQPSRLPATILSRCQRIRIAAPERSHAVAWLKATRGPGDWEAVLDIVGEAPMLAAESDSQALVQIGAEVRRGLEEAAAGASDPVVTAERWARAELPLRLRCFENWLT